MLQNKIKFHGATFIHSKNDRIAVYPTFVSQGDLGTQNCDAFLHLQKTVLQTILAYFLRVAAANVPACCDRYSGHSAMEDFRTTDCNCYFIHTIGIMEDV